MSGRPDVDVLIERAAACAPLIDRAVIAVHRSVPAMVGPAIRSAMAEHGVASPAVLGDLAEFVAAGAWDPSLLAIRYRYGELDQLGDVVTGWRTAGLVDAGGPTDALVAFCARVYELRGEVATGLWDERTADAVAGVALDAAHAGAGALLARAMALPVPGAPGPRCHHALTLLRFARHGAHHAAWSAHGLDRHEWTALVREGGDDGGHTPLATLVERQLVDADGATTGRGRALVRQVERDTNVWCTPMMVAVGERFDAWAAGLADLAVEDPAQPSAG